MATHTSCWCILVNEVVEIHLLFPTCITNQGCKQAYLRSSFSVKITKESSLPKTPGLPKPIAWSQMKTNSITSPGPWFWVISVVLKESCCILTAENWWVFVDGFEQYLITTLQLAWWQLQMVLEKEISQKFDQLTLLPVLRKVTSCI